MNLIALFYISMLIGLSKAQPAAWGIDDSGGEFGLNTGLRVKIIIDGEPADAGFVGAMGPAGLFNGIGDFVTYHDEHFIDDPGMTSGNYFELQIFGTPDEVYTLYFSPDGNQELLLAPTYTFVSYDTSYLEFTYTTPVNCVGDFDEWTTCSGGTQSKTYSVTQEAAGTGTACSHPDGHTETQNCQGADGAACTLGSECVSGTCTNSLCAAASTEVSQTWSLVAGWNFVALSIEPSNDNFFAMISDSDTFGCTDFNSVNCDRVVLANGDSAKYLNLPSYVNWYSDTEGFNANFGEAFWYKVNTARDIVITGTLKQSHTYTLSLGWNYAGLANLDAATFIPDTNGIMSDRLFLESPETDDRMVDISNGDSIKVYTDPSLGTFWYVEGSFSLSPGEGFFVYKKTNPETFTVTN